MGGPGSGRRKGGTSKSSLAKKKYAEFNQLGGKTSKLVRARSLIGAKEYGFSTKAMSALDRKNAITKRKSGLKTGKTYLK